MVYLGGLGPRNGNHIGEQIQACTETKQSFWKNAGRAFYSRAIGINLYVILIPWTNVLIASCCIGSEEVIRHFVFDNCFAIIHSRNMFCLKLN